MNRPTFRLFFVASSLLLLAACGDEEETTADTGTDSGTADAVASDTMDGMGDMGMGDMGADMGGMEAIEDTEGASVNGTFFLSYVLDAAAPGVGDTFGMTVSVFESDETTPVSDADLALSETMPMMGHGMDTEPTIAANGDGTFAVANLAYSMEGLWHYDFTITSGDRTDMIAFATTCCE
ncbi:MAG: hypothetical protein ACJAYU_000314 [Bradymonadia bacterium]|jgi:hypothetical protein